MHNGYYTKVTYEYTRVNYKMRRWPNLGNILQSNIGYFASVSNEGFRFFPGTHKRRKIRKALKWQEVLLLCFPCRLRKP